MLLLRLVVQVQAAIMEAVDSRVHMKMVSPGPVQS